MHIYDQKHNALVVITGRLQLAHQHACATSRYALETTAPARQYYLTGEISSARRCWEVSDDSHLSHVSSASINVMRHGPAPRLRFGPGLFNAITFCKL